jgi:hypothetical protein
MDAYSEGSLSALLAFQVVEEAIRPRPISTTVL